MEWGGQGKWCGKAKLDVEELICQAHWKEGKPESLPPFGNPWVKFCAKWEPHHHHPR